MQAHIRAHPSTTHQEYARRWRVIGDDRRAALPVPAPSRCTVHGSRHCTIWSLLDSNGQTSILARDGYDANDPYVWSGRASQVDFAELAVSGLASMYPAFDWSVAPGHHGYQRACDLIKRQTSIGPVGSPVFACAGKTEPPFRLNLSQTSAGIRRSMGQLGGSTNFAAKTALCECTRDNVYSLCARKNHHPRDWLLPEVRKSEPNGARGL